MDFDPQGLDFLLKGVDQYFIGLKKHTNDEIIMLQQHYEQLLQYQQQLTNELRQKQYESQNLVKQTQNIDAKLAQLKNENLILNQTLNGSTEKLEKLESSYSYLKDMIGTESQPQPQSPSHNDIFLTPKRESYVQTSPPRTPTMSFIEKARDTIPYSIYSKILNEIHQYQKKEQSYEDTMLRAEVLLCPEYSDLFSLFRTSL